MKDRLFTRSEIAEHLGVSRMTLSRWEKKLPLPLSPTGIHIGVMATHEVDSWYKKLIKRFGYLEYYSSRRLSKTNVT